MREPLPYDQIASVPCDNRDNLTVDLCRMTRWPADRPSRIVIRDDDATLILDPDTADALMRSLLKAVRRVREMTPEAA